MKTFKLRGWDLHLGGRMVTLSGINYCTKKAYSSHFGEYNTDTIIEIMQFTGFFDTKGKRIYERDIVEKMGCEKCSSPHFGEIRFKRGSFVFYDYKLDENIFFHEFVNDDDLLLLPLRVIGNIYKNPELVKTLSEEWS